MSETMITALIGAGSGIIVGVISSILTARVAIRAARLPSLLAHQTRISEFRQLWINDLRADIADYVGAARRWHKAYEDKSDSTGGESTEDIEAHQREKFLSLENEAKVIL